MNESQISFIICTNNEAYFSECSQYIHSLKLPSGFTSNVIAIRGASSLASGYQKGMESTDAKYKIYLHQDTFLIHKMLLLEAISLFRKYPSLGMLGVVGVPSLPESGIMWETPGRRCGTVVSDLVVKTTIFNGAPIQSDFEKVQAIDGLFMMTQYDVPWRRDLFTSWDFYDLSQSLEFRRSGYAVGVPKQETPWCLHDKDIINLSGYEQTRKVFLQEYLHDGRFW